MLRKKYIYVLAHKQNFTIEMSIILNYSNHHNAYKQEGRRDRNYKKPHLSETHTVSFPSLVIDQIFKR